MNNDRQIINIDQLSHDVRNTWNNAHLDAADYILLLPHDDTHLNAQLRAAFKEKLRNRRGTILEGRHTDELIALYSLYCFTDKLIIGSFDLPPGRKLRNLLNSGIATEAELINNVILGCMDDNKS